MVQCGPGSSVANPNVCPYSVNAGFLNTTWKECVNEIQSQGMSKVSYQGDGSSFEGGDVCLRDRSTGCTYIYPDMTGWLWKSSKGGGGAVSTTVCRFGCERTLGDEEGPAHCEM